MTAGNLLDIQPTELKFLVELRKQSSSSLRLTNNSENCVAFMVKTTNPKKYCVRPNTGIVLPGSTCSVTVTMQAPKELPPDMLCKDKFLLLSVVAPEGATVNDITSDMFNKGNGRVVEEFKLRVIYEAMTAGNLLHIQPALTGNLLNIQPTELKFLVELRKQSSSYLRLTNNSEKYVAFKVKTTNQKNYCVRPNIGIVLPGSTCSVTVTMQAPKDSLPDMQCRDKFLLQSFVAPEGATANDITSEMFNERSGRVVEEFKLRVICIPAKPPSPVPVGFEEARILVLGLGLQQG
ncbi:Major sperm protein [Corchorus capsularis]|uniref:Major sperm protein n=1 Tax=Corchorus capsularis TaxID=210143 RepID=A0A1R3I7H0_COCAP|nr:Major sperm protein [Corchorus capsularis]